MSSVERLPNGRYPPGVSGGRQGGRKRRASSADDVLREAFAETVVSMEGAKRRRIAKATATAKQIANEGATGKSARLALAELQKAEQRAASTVVAEPILTENDEAILARFVAHIRIVVEQEIRDADAARV